MLRLPPRDPSNQTAAVRSLLSGCLPACYLRTWFVLFDTYFRHGWHSLRAIERLHPTPSLPAAAAACAHLVDIADHLVDGLILGLEAQGLHGRLELLGVDRPRPVRVEEVERLPDLLDLFLRQPGPLVRLRRSLRGGSARLANRERGGDRQREGGPLIQYAMEITGIRFEVYS